MRFDNFYIFYNSQKAALFLVLMAFSIPEVPKLFFWVYFSKPLSILTLKPKEGSIFMPNLLRKKKPVENALLKELQETRLELETAYSIFENAVDPDLVSSSIYRINSVQERYQFLLKQIKKAEAILQSS